MAHVIINALSLRPGGGLQVIAGLLSRFDDTNKFTVLWSDPKSLEMFQNIVPERANISYLNPISSKSNFVIFLWSMFNLKKYVAASKCDIVFNINHHFPTKKTKQIVYHLNVLRFDRPRQMLLSLGELAERLRDWRARKALSSSNQNVFESQFLLEEAKKKNPAPVNPSVIYIGRDEQLTICNSPKVGTQSSKILALTSPQPHKDNPTLIRMLAKLCELEPKVDWHLTIAGGTREGVFDDLIKLSQQLGVENRIDWPGFCTHDELAQLAAESICLVSTSRVESFSMVSLEAMSWGIPPIVANCSSMPESIAEAGLLATPGDATSFATHVIELRNNPDAWQKLVKAGKARSELLTWNKAAIQFEKLFKNLA